MILLPCAWCGPRDAAEFSHVGEVPSRPDPRTATPREWRGYLYLRANPRGWTTETWYHRMGCRRFITVERHTETNEIRSVQPAGAATPNPTAAREPAATSEATAAREPTATLEPAATPEPAPTREAPATREAPLTPEATAAREPTATPEATATREATGWPAAAESFEAFRDHETGGARTPAKS